MSGVCILTDNTVQFTRPTFPGRDRVYIVSPRSHPVSSGGYHPPEEQDFLQWYHSLGQRYDSILVLTGTSSLCPVAEIAHRVAHQYTNHLTIQVIDSQNIAVGLGWLVQIASEAAISGASLTKIERLVRQSIAHIYMLFCIPALIRLAQRGTLSYAQAVVGEMLGWWPVFVLEEGHLTPMQKVRAARQLVDVFQEYLSEFESPLQICFLYGSGRQVSAYTQPINEFVRFTFPKTTFNEYTLNHALKEMLGEPTFGLAVLEHTAGHINR